MSVTPAERARLLQESEPTMHNSYVDRGFGFWASIRYFTKILEAPLFDASPLASGAAAAMAARSVVAVTDKLHITEPKGCRTQHGIDKLADTRDLPTRIRRRGLLYGVFFWLYISMHRRAQFDDQRHTESIRLGDRIKKSALISSTAAVSARLTVNIWTNISDAARAKFMSRKIAFKYLTRHEANPGLWSIFVSQPPALAALAYHGGTIFLFEAMRRLIRGREPLDVDLYNRTHTGPIVATALFNGSLASICAVATSAATYRFSKPYYKNEVARPTAINLLPKEYLWRREALLVGLTYGCFSLIQPFMSPHHSRCGFGY